MARAKNESGNAPKELEIQAMPVDRLLLDPQNPRLASTIEPTDQEAILRVLWREMAVDELVYSIAANGYFKEEPLFVVPEKPEEAGSDTSRFYVVEGNRRLAAVRILLDDDLRALLRATDLPQITASEKERLRQLPVSVYNSREELWTYLSFRHINSPKPWDSFSKAKYVAQVHDQYGKSLEEIAEKIGDRHTTVERLYRGFEVLQQAERERLFDSDDRVRGKFYFSHLYTALDYPEFQEFLGMDPGSFDPTNPVPRDRLGNLAELMQWLYGKKSEGVQPLVVRQNPDLAHLRDAIAKSESLAQLRSGYPLETAYNTSLGDEVRFEQSLTTALQELKQANATIATGYDGNEPLLKVGADAKKQADDLYSRMRKLGRRR